MSWQAPCRRYALFWHPQSRPIAHSVFTRPHTQTHATWKAGGHDASSTGARYTEKEPQDGRRASGRPRFIAHGTTEQYYSTLTFFFPPQMLLQLAGRTRLPCVLPGAEDRFPMCVIAIIVVLQVNKLCSSFRVCCTCLAGLLSAAFELSKCAEIIRHI